MPIPNLPILPMRRHEFEHAACLGMYPNAVAIPAREYQRVHLTFRVNNSKPQIAVLRNFGQFAGEGVPHAPHIPTYSPKVAFEKPQYVGYRALERGTEMDRFVRRENVKHYRDLLARAMPDAERLRIQALLDEELKKQQDGGDDHANRPSGPPHRR